MGKGFFKKKSISLALLVLLGFGSYYAYKNKDKINQTIKQWL